MKKIVTFCLFLSLLFSTNFTFANTVNESYLKELAKEMITPNVGDILNSSFRENVRKKDEEITKKFESLSKEEQDKVMKLVRNNLQENVYEARGGWLNNCPYEKFTKRITFRDPVNQGNVNLHYGTLTSAVVNNTDGEVICDNKIWFETSKPYIWGTTYRAREYLGKYSTVLKNTFNGKDEVLLGGTWGAWYYGTDWFDIHTEMVIWGY